MATHNARRRGAGDVAPVAANDADRVTLWRAQPVRAGGPVRAEVAVKELEAWLARGWQQTPAPGDPDGA